MTPEHNSNVDPRVPASCGGTPGGPDADDEQFRTSGNPYASGSRPSQASAHATDDGFNQGVPFGYFTNPPSAGGNPSAGAAGTYQPLEQHVTDGIAGGFDNRNSPQLLRPCSRDRYREPQRSQD